MKRRALTTKLIRDLLHLRAPLIAIAIVMACGVGGLVMTRTTSESLRASLDAYYDRYRFADLFLSLKRAPEAIRPEIAANWAPSTSSRPSEPGGLVSRS